MYSVLQRPCSFDVAVLQPHFLVFLLVSSPLLQATISYLIQYQSTCSGFQVIDLTLESVGWALIHGYRACPYLKFFNVMSSRWWTESTQTFGLGSTFRI